MRKTTSLPFTPKQQLILAPFLASAAWLAYSAFAVDHQRPLPPALPGARERLAASSGEICLYGSNEAEGVPLLLVHSVNAAASAYEMRPIFLHYMQRRPVYAVDLPGFGLSERRARTYTARDMTDAIHAAAAAIQRRHPGAIDLMALSTSCEYAARAALERAEVYRSVGLISPVGFDASLSGEGRAGSNKGSPAKLAVASFPLWSQALYDLVVSKPSMRFFLQKTFGSRHINEGLLAYDQLTAQQPRARYAVWSFLSGYLFADDVTRLYRALKLPVWTVHGRRGDFVDYRKERQVAGKTNWTFDEFDSGAMPQFECMPALAASYEAFVRTLP